MRSVIFVAFLWCTAAVAQESCPVRVGGVVAQSGAQGAIGKAIAEAGRLAVEHVNKAGGVKGCQVEFILREFRALRARDL